MFNHSDDDLFNAYFANMPEKKKKKKKKKSSSEGSSKNTTTSTDTAPDDGRPKALTNKKKKTMSASVAKASEKPNAGESSTTKKKSASTSSSAASEASSPKPRPKRKDDVNAIRSATDLETQRPSIAVSARLPSSVIFDVETNEISMARAPPDRSASTTREEILKTILVSWRYVCIFMSASVVTTEILNSAIDYELFSIGVRTMLVMVAGMWRPVCVGVSLVIFWLEIMFRALGGRIRDFGLNHSSPQYENFSEGYLFAYLRRAWKPISGICLVLSILLIDIFIRLYVALTTDSP